MTEQKKGMYRYFVDLGDRMEVAESRTVYVDEEQQVEVDKSQLVFGMELGAPQANENSDDETDGLGYGARVVSHGRRPFYQAEEVRTFRTLGLEPGLKLLGFKDRSEIAFEDNVKHSIFIYPDEQVNAVLSISSLET